MATPTGPDGLTPLAPGVFAWIQSPGGHGRTNAGVVADEDGCTVVDALLTPAQAAPLAAAVEALGRPVRRLVYSSSHIEFTGGSSLFPLAARYGCTTTSALLDQPPNPSTWRLLHPGHAEHFDELVTRPVSHTVAEPAWLSPAVTVVPTEGQQEGNLVAQVPGAGILFAGAMCAFGVTPLAFDGDPGAWADALGVLLELGEVIVPGIGPVGGADEVIALQAYLYACVDAEGDPAALPPGPWDDWPDRHFDAVNVERAAMLAAGDDGVPPTMLRLLGLA
jgi:cyclase